MSEPRNDTEVLRLIETELRRLGLTDVSVTTFTIVRFSGKNQSGQSGEFRCSPGNAFDLLSSLRPDEVKDYAELEEVYYGSAEAEEEDDDEEEDDPEDEEEDEEDDDD